MTCLKIIAALAFPFLAIHHAAAQDTHRFTLKGHLSGQDTGMITLSYTDLNGKQTTDTQYLKEGAFFFTGLISGPTSADLVARPKTRYMADPHYLYLFLDPDTMEISAPTGDFHTATLRGAPTQEESDAYNRATHPLFERVREYRKEGMEEKADSLFGLLRTTIPIAYAQSHPNSYVSPQLLYVTIGNKLISSDSAVALFSHLSTRVQESDWGKLIMGMIRQQYASTIGTTAHDFTLKDVEGNPVSLTSFKGKNVVLLDFWASWCVPCRAFTPHLKDLETQYRGKGLVILTVSVDFTPEAWKKAVLQDSMEQTLRNIYVGDQAGDMRGWYSIEGIPADVLIDKNGVIAGRYMSAGSGTEQDMYKKVSELLGN